jgi:hypothetical protein
MQPFGLGKVAPAFGAGVALGAVARGASGSAAQPVAPLMRQVSVDPATSVAGHPDRHGYTVIRHAANGAQIVVNARAVPNGPALVVAYRQTRDTVTGAVTRLYTDGHQITVGHDFVTHAAPHQPTVTAHQNGLRDAYLPDGRPLFHERFEDRRVGNGGIQHVLVRSIFAGAPVAAAGSVTPIEQIYGVVPYGGSIIYPYQPVAFRAAVLSVFLTALSQPLQLPPDPAVVFEDPTIAYTDPADALADDEVETAMASGMSDAPSIEPLLPVSDTVLVADADAPDSVTMPAMGPPAVPDDMVRALTTDVAALERNVVAARAANADLQTQLAVQPGLPTAQPAAAPGRHPPVVIPTAVRDRIRHEVRDDLVLHEQQRALSLPGILASPGALDFIFQVGDIVDVTDAATGEECLLTTGDLIRFNELPAEASTAAQMRIVTSKFGDCQAGTAVAVSAPDLQDMLNSFNHRLESSVVKLSSQIASAGPAQNTVVPPHKVN